MKRISWIFLSLFILTACVTGRTTGRTWVNHSFEFNTNLDSPDIEVLDYNYWDGTYIGIHADQERIMLGQVFSANSITGVMPRGDTLYVKWRDKHSHHIYEDKVDLKNRMPRDISDLTVYFMIKGPQLYVYLIYPGLKDVSVPEGPVRTYRHQKQVQIYPDLRK